MKKIFFLLIFTLLLNCSNQKKVYWCGDHPCINKKEREAYFKKNMSVEVKTIKVSDIDKSEIRAITEQARLNEKKRIKKEKDLAKIARLEEKRKIKEEKALVKQEKLEEKRRLKEEKKLEKLSKLEEKRLKKSNKKLSKNKLSKKNENNEIKIDTGVAKVSFSTKEFSELIKKINQKNMFRSYPDINDIPR